MPLGFLDFSFFRFLQSNFGFCIYLLEMYAWTHAQELLSDPEFLDRYTKGTGSYLSAHIAFLYSKRRLLAVASNTTKFGHAEMNCMHAFYKRYHKQRFMRLKLIVTRISNRGNSHSMSRPCDECCREIQRLMPGTRVFYTSWDGSLCEEYSFDNKHISLSKRNRLCGTPRTINI